MAALCATHGIALNPADPGEPEALVLAIKPQGLEAAGPALASLAGPAPSWSRFWPARPSPT